MKPVTQEQLLTRIQTQYQKQHLLHQNDQHVFKYTLEEWREQPTTRMRQWLSSCQPYIAYCLKNRSLQKLTKTKDIRAYMIGNSTTQLPKIYTSPKKSQKKKTRHNRQQENTIDNYLQYQHRHKPPKPRTQQRSTAGTNTERTDYYTNQGRPPDKNKTTEATLQEYKFTCKPK